MDYTTRFIKRKGVSCTVNSRSPTVTTKAIISPSTKSGSRITERNDFMDGMIPITVSPGETLQADDKELLIMSAGSESGVTKFMAARVNSRLDWQQETASISGKSDVVMLWHNVSTSIPAYVQEVRAELRQEDPGLLPNTKYIIFIPGSNKVQRLDRVAFEATSCQVDKSSEVVLDGLLKLYCSEDTRP